MQSARDVVQLWDSAAAKEACTKALIAQMYKRAELIRQGADQPDRNADPETWKAIHEEPAACTEATVARLTHGTNVDILPANEQCEGYLRIAVTSGNSKGKSGCLARDFIVWTSESSATQHRRLLTLSSADKERGRDEMMVWESFLSKARCEQAIKDAKLEERLPPAATTCFGSDCYETRCVGASCSTNEQGLLTKNLKYCEYGRVNLKPGTAVRTYDEADECGSAMVRIALAGKWAGHDGCVDPANLAE